MSDPWNLTEARGFVALASYYRRFVGTLAEIARPIHLLTQKNQPFVWTDSQQTAFGRLKHCLVTASVLSLPRDEGRYILDSYASDRALSLVLQQEQDGLLKVIAYASQTLQPAERSYCTTRKELLAVIYGLKHFRQFLLGRRFVCQTDHAALTSVSDPGTGEKAGEVSGSIGRVRYGNCPPAWSGTPEQRCFEPPPL